MRLNAIASILALTIGAAPTTLAAQDNPANAPEITRAVVEEAMKAATRFMVEKVALKGGYVWSYLPDMSKRWGEMEAYDTMVWVQPPGTATMGHLFLDAYHATGDECYYDAAMETAGALIWGQTEAGGWNYMFDFAGPASLQRWYDTIGEAGWRLEEFHHNWENATFDDAGTAESTQFLLRLYLEKLDPTLRPALDKAIDLIVGSQQPIGTWPQRYPENLLWEEDYTSYPTLNDDVASENMETLIMAWQTLGRPDLLPVIHRGMDVFLLLQQGDDQPGFSLQYDADLNPVAARSYEPLALATHTTASALRKLMDFYAMTGDTRYLARVDEGLGWLERVRLPEDQWLNGRQFPTFIEIGSDRPIYVHRRGSNAVSGEYFWDYSPENLLGHYSGKREIDLDGMRARYDELTSAPVADVTANSPLMHGNVVSLPEFFTLDDVDVSDLNAPEATGGGETVDADAAAGLVAALNDEGYWPTELVGTSKPYIGPAPAEPSEGDFAGTHVGDDYDTSPYETDTPETGISTSAYIENMGALIRFLEAGN